jgi:nucleotide-binding universal stress UspA family protein
MPPYRRLAIVAPPPGLTAGAAAYLDLLASVLAPEAVRLVVPLAEGATASGADADVSRTLAALPPSLAAMHGGGALTTVAIHGELLDAVLRESMTMPADLIVIGADRAGESRRPLVRRLAMQAPCSIWMVPSSSCAALGRILVPIDFSARSADALHVATALAAATGAACAALHVRFDPTLASHEEGGEAVLGREREAFQIFAARVELHGVDLDVILEEGPDVARAILRVAESYRADLVVMGTRGRTRAAAMLIGSETEHTLQESGGPVLAVKRLGSHLRFVEALLDPRFRQREGPRFG